MSTNSTAFRAEIVDGSARTIVGFDSSSKKPVPTGFTLIEMMVTVAVLAILASVALPMAEVFSQRNKEQDLRLALRQIRTAIDEYKQAVDGGRIIKKVDESGYPPTLSDLVEGVKDAKSPEGKKIYFLRRLPRDPMAEDVEDAPEDTWGQRSYDSPPDDPQSGKDVFDVFSLSKDAGLNGISYREW